jgi:hypothetical protein
MQAYRQITQDFSFHTVATEVFTFTKVYYFSVQNIFVCYTNAQLNKQPSQLNGHTPIDKCDIWNSQSAVMCVNVFWFATSCSLVSGYWHSDEPTTSVFQVGQYATHSSTGGSSRILQNVCNHLPCYEASHTKIQQSSLIKRVCKLQLKYNHKNRLLAHFDGINSSYIITVSLWLIYYPFNFTHEANAFGIYTICRDTSSLTETQNNRNLSNVREVRRNIHVTVIAHFISFLIVQKYFSGRSTATINFSYTVADWQHLYFWVFNGFCDIEISLHNSAERSK